MATTAPARADRSAWDLRRTLRAVLPTGGHLAPDVWRHRHRWILGVLWLHVPAIVIFGMAQDVPARHLALEVLPVAALAAGAARLSSRPRWSAAVTAVGLATCSAILVHLADGAIEMHFHFFVMIGVVTLYQDWGPFLASIAYVVAHHSVVGTLDPESVFNHPAALHSPFRWALIHGGFILAMSAVGLVSWRLNELTGVRLADREVKLAHAQSIAGLGSWEWDVPAGTIEWSPELFRLFGLEVGEIQPSFDSFVDHVHPEDRPIVNAAVAHTHQTLEPFNFDFRAVLPDGRERWMHSQGEVVATDGRTPTLLYGTAHDITTRKLAERDLQASQRAGRLIQDVAVAANQATSLDHAMRSGLIAVCEFTGWPAGRFHLVNDRGDDLGSTGLAYAGDREHRTFLDLVDSSPVADDDLPRSVWRSGRPAWSAVVGSCDPVVGEAAAEIGIAGRFALPVATGQDVVAVFEFFTEDTEGPTDTTIHLLENVVTQLGRVVERRRAQEALAHQAHHDSLTELPNRVLFLDRLGYELRRQARNPSTLGVLFMDLDGFKVINDSLGHDAGDTILIAIADRLRRAVREGDTIARFGGDEFAVLAPAVEGESDLVALADRIAAAFTAPFPVGEDREFVVTASIGIAVADDPATDPAGLLRDADLAMYRAKDQGRARHAVFDSSMHAAANERLSMATALRRAVDLGELCLHYQPQIVLGGDGTVAGVEALLRWEHPELGLISPAEVIPVAEATGLIVPIGAWVIGEATRQLGEWQRSGRPDLAMCVNVSARQLVDDAVVAVVAEALEDTGVIPSTLCLEITESILMEDPDHYADTLAQLKGLGVSLSVDDFGTGYSSLAYLQVLPADFLKVDRSFVERLGTNPRAAAIVGTIIDLAHSLDLGVVAEGVETEEQADELTRLDCDQAQGFLFARPAPAATITPMLGLRVAALR
jgi:diguanylate cyclase (GGDEF)-like protein/PAS domain S-box-containing protein